MIKLPDVIKRPLRRLLLPGGMRPRTIRGGALAGHRMRLDLSQDTQVWRGIYEQDLQQWLVDRVRPGSVCIDIGAAEGTWTLLMASLAGPTGAVYAFEPSARGDDVEPNLSLNGDRQLASVHLIRGYAADVDGTADDGVPLVHVGGRVAEDGLARVDVVKVDVDGAEMEVLRGLKEVLERDRPHLTVEIHSPALLEECLKLLSAIGYEMRRVEAPPHEHRPIPFNPTLFSLPREP